MGSPDFAVPTLDALVESERFRPVAVVTQPDRGRGRGKKLSPTPVKKRATAIGLPVREMSRDNYTEIAGWVGDLAPDVIVVVAFGIILRADLLELPTHGCVNVHASLLPKYRGVSPVQAAILAGDPVTGCTTMKIDEGIDTGDVLLRESLDIRPDDTAGTLTDRLAALGAGLIVRTLDGLLDGSVVPRPQPDEGSSYVKKIKKTHGRIDWTRDALDVERRIRAMTPWPSAYAFHGEKRLIVIRAVADPAAAHEEEPGTVLSLDPLTVACGGGVVKIDSLKPEGKREMSPGAYVAGHALATGERLTGDPPQAG
jgi:methionyl-tRNA formyltransferase